MQQKPPQTHKRVPKAGTPRLASSLQTNRELIGLVNTSAFPVTHLVKLPTIGLLARVVESPSRPAHSESPVTQEQFLWTAKMPFQVELVWARGTVDFVEGANPDQGKWLTLIYRRTRSRRLG